MSIALGTEHEMHMLRILLSSVARPALQNFSTLSHKRYDFRKKLLSVERVLILSTTFVQNISHSKKKSARYDQKCILLFM